MLDARHARTSWLHDIYYRSLAVSKSPASVFDFCYRRFIYYRATMKMASAFLETLLASVAAYVDDGRLLMRGHILRYDGLHTGQAHGWSHRQQVTPAIGSNMIFCDIFAMPSPEAP